MRTFLPIFWAFFAVLSLQAQEITLTGQVSDSTGLGIDMANVIAINQATDGLESFGITNHKGVYKLNLKSGQTYTVKVSYLGFSPASFPFTAGVQDAKRDVTLEAQVEDLDEVELVYEMPVQVKGDTLVYNTDSFVSGTEKKLKDVLENLPGVEVNDDGQIEVEGKAVTKVMVEGKEFFDGDSKLAVENIPANALSKVEVLRNHNEVAQMKGLTNDDDNVALNIRLKEGKKKFWFGELTLGAGPDGRYLAHPKVFYYSPKFSLNLLTDLNNVGEVPFTRRDYRNFTGGMRSVGSRTGSSINTGGDALGLATMQNNRAKDIDTKFGALNFSYEIQKGWDISGYGIYSYTGTLMESARETTFINDGVTENAATRTDQTVHLGLAKFSSIYKPNDNLQLDYDIFLKASDDHEDIEVLTVSDITDQVEETQAQKPISVNQNMNLYYTLNEKNVFAVESRYLHQDEDPFYNAIREEFAFTELFPVDEDQSVYDMSQNKRIVTNKVDAKVDYYYLLTPKSSLNLSLGTVQSNQNFDSNIYQMLDNGNEFSMVGDEFGNRVNYHVSDIFSGVHYKWVSGIFTFNPGLILHQFDAKNTQLGTTVHDKKTALLPDLYINAQLEKSENLRFNYRVTRTFTDINKFAEGYVLNSYNSTYRGNRELESALNHNLSLNFFSFNMFNFTNIFGNITYTKRIDALKNGTIQEGINRVGTTLNSNFDDESLSASGRYERIFGKIKGSARANMSWSSTYNNINGEWNTSESLTQNYTVSLATNFRDKPNLEMGYRYTANDFENGRTQSTFYTQRPFVRFDAAFLKSFIFTADYDYYKYTDKAETVDNSWSFLKADLTYQKKDSRWEFGVKGTNLLNTGSLNQNSTNELYFTNQRYFVQPRYVLFTVKYDL
ncbi:TonB-dependent receptor [Sediminicola luteus]|uniref:TonB-dependent receptor n=1 Tax=Sediminicola luteus TaxID=319238 RepID=A0A2A4G5Q4_9FLAO|nr:TonB-dependent receptor [Sediminicola luteus]PCE63318.1 TonB-dependent receptor [Sediminicola luteus]